MCQIALVLKKLKGTGQFCIMMDKVFDYLNVRNTKEHIIKSKPFLKPYVLVEDIRFAWLDDFFQYLKSWKESIEARNDANHTENAKSKMFISRQSYEGLQIAVLSFKEVYNFFYNKVFLIFFQKGFLRMILKIILVNKRAIVRRSDNPTVHDFG